MNSKFRVVWLKWDNAPHLTLLTEAEFDSLPGLHGGPIGLTAARLRFSAAGELADFVKFGIYIMVSEMVRMVIARYGGEAEFLPVEIETDSGTKKYFLLNVLHKCDCLDFKASGVVVRYGIIFGFERLCLLEDRIDDAPVFLLPENGQHVIFLRQDVVDELINFNCTGVLFIPPEECRMGL